jgi:hypothetical protein
LDVVKQIHVVEQQQVRVKDRGVVGAGGPCGVDPDPLDVPAYRRDRLPKAPPLDGRALRR